MFLERADEACCTAVAFGFADQGGRTGDPQKPQRLLKHLRPILTAMLMPESSAMGDVLSKGPKGSADTWADGLQGFTAGPLLGGVEAHTRRRVLIPRDTNGPLPLLTR